MKQLGSLVPILLLLGVGITSGLTAAELTASQQVQPQTATVGETAIVTLTLTYNGGNATQIMVVPLLPPGIVTDMPGAKAASLSSGSSVPISYPIRAVESGNYQIASQISYTEERTTRRLNMLSEFTATGRSTPGPSMPGASGSSMPSPLLHLDSPMSGDNQPSNPSPMMPDSMPAPDTASPPDPSPLSSPDSGSGNSNSSLPS
ncbi:MAG: hypothetical protein ACE14P_12275 [Methanotrichaceae archaeon]